MAINLIEGQSSSPATSWILLLYIIKFNFCLISVISQCDKVLTYIILYTKTKFVFVQTFEAPQTAVPAKITSCYFSQNGNSEFVPTKSNGDTNMP